MNFWKAILVCLLGTLDGLQAQSYPSRFSPDLPHRPSVAGALRWIDEHQSNGVEEWIRVTRIPAPSGKEHDRASYVKDQMEKVGLAEVRMDEALNVEGTLRGSEPGAGIVFTAHTDTVFAADTPLQVTREHDTLRAPGIFDNSASVVNMLNAIRALRAANVQMRRDVIFVATSQEEVGLKGMQHWLARNRARVQMIIALDSSPKEIVSYGALGIRWLKFHYTAKGANTNVSQGQPNPAKAIAAAIREIYAIPLPVSTRENTAVYNVGMIGGGKVVNAISEESFFTVDIRVNDKKAFESLVERITEIAARAAKVERVGFRAETLLALPAGGTRDDLQNARAHPLVQTAVDIREFLGLAKDKRVTAVPTGSTDANLGVALGIPSIGIATALGGKQHTVDEFAEIDNGGGVKLIVLLAAALAELR